MIRAGACKRLKPAACRPLTAFPAARAENRRFWLLSTLRAHAKRHRKPIYIGKR